MCEVAAGFIESKIISNSTEAAIVDALDSACTYLPGNLKSSCDSVVNVYGRAIVDLLLKSLTPSEVCKTLQLC